MLRAVLAGVLVLAAMAMAQAAPPGIVLIVADDLGRQLGCYGDRLALTPQLDALAADGTRFEYAFCTTASCSASRSVILSGRYSHATGQFGHEHGYNHFRSYEDMPTLPVRLAKAGFRTARIGKLHVGPAETYRFDEVLGDEGRNSVAMADRCRQFLQSVAERPFFLYFCPHDVHRSGNQAQDQPNRFGNLPQGYPEVPSIPVSSADVPVPPHLPDTPACRAELAQYYQSVARLDSTVGRLMQVLRDTGRYDDTLIVFVSDNGEPFPAAKTTAYEPGIRLPCLVRSPRSSRRGVVSQALVSWVDLTPTILDFAQALPAASSEGAEHAALQGRSFLSILAEEQPSGWDVVYGSHTFHEVTMYYPMRTVRERRYKLIWNIAHPLPFPSGSDLWYSTTWQDRFRLGPDTLYGRRTIRDYLQRPEFELFDLEQDPEELHNLAADPAQAARLAAMQAQLKEFQQRTSDPWLLKWEYE